MGQHKMISECQWGYKVHASIPPSNQCFLKTIYMMKKNYDKNKKSSARLIRNLLGLK